MITKIGLNLFLLGVLVLSALLLGFYPQSQDAKISLIAESPSISGTGGSAGKGDTEEIREPAVHGVDKSTVAKETVPQTSLGDLVDRFLSRPLSAQDLSAVKAAFKSLQTGKLKQVRTTARKIKNPAAKKLVLWGLYRHSKYDANTEDLVAFLDANPDWPSRERKQAKIEKQLTGTDDITENYFETYDAKSVTGKIAKVRLLLASEKPEDAKSLIKNVWRHEELSTAQEKTFRGDFLQYLDESDHSFRARKILYKDKKSLVKSAQRLKDLLPEAEWKILNVRIAMLRRTKNAKNLYNKLSDQEKADPAILYSAVNWHRRTKKKSAALALLRTAPAFNGDPEIADRWWRLRRLHIFEAINSGKPKAAYEIARNYGSVTVNNLNQARFLSGWLALRFVKKTDEALEHFTALSQSADGPRSRSRSHFWLGRTALARKDESAARRHFTAGAKYFNTFYGQLSRQRIETETAHISIELPRFATEKSAEEFFKRDAVQALAIAHKAELKTTVVRFLTRLRNRTREPADLHLLAELSTRLGHPQQAVRIGKRAMFFDIPLVNFAYPIDALPEFEPLRPLPERALIFAIARQESEFNPKIVSHAGARGLMQVMPITARHVSRQHKIKYELKRLLTDPAYNCRIGSAYIADRMDEFNGSYVKTIAGFNAGPGRVRQWIRKFGDPSAKNVDPIDWIERIPFTETRNYVQKVLANIQVYRARLGTPDEALRIVADLNRGRS